MTPSGITFTVSAEDLSLIREGLDQLPNHPAHDLAHRVLSRIQGEVFRNLPPAQGEAFLKVMLAPLALRAARTTIGIQRRRIAELERRLEARA